MKRRKILKTTSKSVEASLNSNNQLLISYASVWEIAIKVKLGKIKLNFPLDEFIGKAVEKHTLEFLSICLPHIYYIQQPPLHHRDPFDRLLIAQSLTENLPVVTSDTIFDAYNVNRIWG